MGLKFFNTLSRSLQDFVPLDPAGKKVGLYCCGPTVYDFAHIGNWRTFVFSDLVRRYLEFKGYEVRHVVKGDSIADVLRYVEYQPEYMTEEAVDTRPADRRRRPRRRELRSRILAERAHSMDQGV